MKRFKLGFRNKSVLEQLSLCEQTVSSIAASGLPQLDPNQLADAQVTVGALRASHERVERLRSELRTEISRRNELLATARKQVLRASLGLAVAVNHEPVKMLAAGLELEASKKTPVGLPAAPDRFRAQPTDNEGEVRLTWKRTVRRCWFRIEYRIDDGPDGWKIADSCSRQTHTLEGLVSGRKHWFRVRAQNAHGESAWSNLATARPK